MSNLPGDWANEVKPECCGAPQHLVLGATLSSDA
jgi:hypothetical protein